MSADYESLLEATCQHLQRLQERGVRYLNVSQDTLAALNRPAPPSAVTPSPLRGQEPAKPLPPYPAPRFRESSALVSPTTPPLAPGANAPASQSPPAQAGEAGMTVTQPETSARTEPADKAEAMGALRARALVCQRCPNLAAARQNVVFGVGDINAALMFVGEAPGADEDAKGEPFVGAAGQLLTKIIQTMGLSRQTVYIGNILKCRPDTPRQSSGNRPPTEEEMETCIPYLLEQIDLIKPRVLVALGATAVKGLLHSKTGITALRGNWQVFRGIPTMPTYHPAYLLRNQALSAKRQVWEDMLKVMEKLGMPISDKQRGYFLKG